MQLTWNCCCVLAGVAMTGTALAGGDFLQPPDPGRDEPGPGLEGICELLDWLGTPLIDRPDNPWVQSVEFSGRAHYQYASVDGEDVFGADFSEDFDEIRRLRFGVDVTFLRFFTAEVDVSLEDDQSPVGLDRDIGYDSLPTAVLTIDLGEAFGAGPFDDLSLSYGRQKVSLSPEVHTSSRRIKTVERSAVANRVFPNRMTGLVLDAERGNWEAALGVFSTDLSRELGTWDAGTAVYGSVTVDLGEDRGEVILDALYNDANGNPRDNQVSTDIGSDLYEWALSAAYVARGERADFLVNGTMGDNGSQFTPFGRPRPTREGNFYGLVVMPSYELLEDRLEGVLRYSLQVADEAEGIRANSRYLRGNHGAFVNEGRGDRHHSIYAGLNYFLCGHKAKVMGGVEWETLETPFGDADAWTWWLAYRTYF